jgi:hypothetical protein
VFINDHKEIVKSFLPACIAHTKPFFFDQPVHIDIPDSLFATATKKGEEASPVGI